MDHNLQVQLLYYPFLKPLIVPYFELQIQNNTELQIVL